MSYMHTETLIIRDGRVVCSTAEAKRWEDDECMPVPGDILIRFQNNMPAEVGRVGMKAVIGGIEVTPINDGAMEE